MVTWSPIENTGVKGLSVLLDSRNGVCEPGGMTDTPAPTTCCDLRRKIVVAITSVLPEEICGVNDSALADVFSFDHQVPSGKPVLAFVYCPWCGVRQTDKSERRVTDANPLLPDDIDDGEEWKDG